MYGADVWKYPANDPLMSAGTSNHAQKRHTSPSNSGIRSNNGRTTDMTDTTWNLVKAFTDSQLAPPSLRGKPADAYLIVRKGEELGWSPLQALDLINVIQGKVVMSAEGMNSLIRGAGHGIELVELSTELCTVKGVRGDGTAEPMTVTYTVEMAERAGLAGKGGSWTKNAEDMLWARAVSRLARWQFPDVFTMHAYTPQDFGEGDQSSSPMMSDAQTEGISEPDQVALPKDTASPAQVHADAAEEALQTVIDADLIDGIAGDPQAQEKASELWDRIEAADG